MKEFATVPTQWVGPIHIKTPDFDEQIRVPLATYESPLWPSTTRGARLTRKCGGIEAVVTAESMTRSIVVEAPSNIKAHQTLQSLQQQKDTLASVISATGRFVRLQDFHGEILGNLIYIRFAMTTGDAAGHNMVTKASDAALRWVLASFPHLKYVSLSANFCTDKKVSAVNGILGRGRSVSAQMILTPEMCQQYLKSTPEAIVNLHIKKNLLGSILAGSLRSANAHFANILLAFYLATGQDAANIVEGSQGLVHCEIQDGNLYFAVSLPNLILGSVGNGKHLDFAQENLQRLGCADPNDPGKNAQRLALIAGATVLCGEISLLAALTNQGELVEAHMKLERSRRAA